MVAVVFGKILCCLWKGQKRLLLYGFLFYLPIEFNHKEIDFVFSY